MQPKRKSTTFRSGKFSVGCVCDVTKFILSSQWGGSSCPPHQAPIPLLWGNVIDGPPSSFYPLPFSCPILYLLSG
eukprot:scaffold269663_cov37-Tisochrysis_lutea.AAC.3